MAERSASDREGAGSSPASGPLSELPTANPGYASWQLAKAFTTAGNHPNAETRERALKKAQRWTDVLQGMYDGTLSVGSRTPLSSTPAWVTPEVVTGGFVTGGLMAGGLLQDHEIRLREQLGLPISGEDRLELNRYFLTEQGVCELQSLVESGCFGVNVPEEGALPVVAWLVTHGHADLARQLVAEITPYFGKLRFFPEPLAVPRRVGQRVFVQSVVETVEKLKNISPNARLLAQKETLDVWTPIYDQLIALFLETVEGPLPTLEDTGSAPTSSHTIRGGWPCRHYNDSWPERGKALLDQVDQLGRQHRLSQRTTHRKSSLAQLLPYLRRCVTSPASLSGRDVGRIRLTLARYHAKRGWPDSASCRQVREAQAVQAQTPLFHLIASTVLPRLDGLPPAGGIEDLATVIEPITAAESPSCHVPPGYPLPKTIRRKIERSLWDTIDVLIERGLITSGEALAKVLPQLTSGVRSAGIGDPTLRSLYAAIYRAFRRRRSLLLLNLESQVRMEELPWVAAIERFRRDNQSTQEIARQTLQEVASLTLSSFPHAILPNKLLQELRALLKTAGLDMPLVDELAADIFMGEFSATFIRSAHQAANLLRGTLYARYYGIDCDELLQIREPKKPAVRRWFQAVVPATMSSSTEPTLIAVCSQRAGVTYGGWSPAVNGMLIEQQQIVTTQNLAQLFAALDLSDSLRGQLFSMSQEALRWICKELQLEKLEWHAKLIKVKQAAYAWRQMLSFLSFITPAEQEQFRVWSAEFFLTQEPQLQVRFGRAVTGLDAALAGHSPDANGGKIFTGWSEKRHWLLDDSPHPDDT